MPILARNLLPLLDLTSLQENDTEETITALCQKAVTPFGEVAAVCVYPRFIPLVRQKLLNSSVKIAAVSNFPYGDASLTSVLSEITQAIQAGADEIDVVMPYQAYLAGEHDYVKDFLVQCRSVCGPKICLKVILETGAFPNFDLIAAASRDVLTTGANFIKTSTGKIPMGATPEAVKTILSIIHETPFKAGCKISGGVRTLAQAAIYWQLAQDIFGPHWPARNTFRFGASRLLDEILHHLEQNTEHPLIKT
ncbi:MAG: deoxyribose-phosphate aldolase [Gammaproteobacteria bacterium]